MRRVAIVVCLILLVGCAKETSALRVTQLDGSPVTAEFLDARGPAVLNFWASWCVYCKKELPVLSDASKRYPEIHFVGVNLGEPPRMAKTFWEALRVAFPTVLDPYGDLRKQFSVFARPTTIFLDTEGNVISRHNGPLTERELELRLQELTEKVQWQSEGNSPSCPEGKECRGQSTQP